MGKITYKHIANPTFADCERHIVPLWKTFMREVPVMTGLNLDTEKYSTEVTAMVKICMKWARHLILAFDGDKAVGMLHGKVQYINKLEHEDPAELKKSGLPEETMRYIGESLGMVGRIEAAADLKKYGLGEMFYFDVMAVLPEYQHQGIATQMYDLVIKKAKELGYKAILSVKTSAYAIRIGDKYGFESVLEWPYKGNFSLYDQMKGKDVHTTCKVMVKKL